MSAVARLRGRLARRFYRLAKRIDGRPQTFTRVKTPGVRMLVPESLFDPTLCNLLPAGPAIQHGRARITAEHIREYQGTTDQ
jgi:hypothetical protein